jgi:hypothetical protein
VEWLKAKSLNSNPSTAKKKKKNPKHKKLVFEDYAHLLRLKSTYTKIL